MSRVNTRSTNMLVRVWDFLTEPHPAVQEIGERRRAKLLSTIALLLTGSLMWAVLSNPSSYGTFIALFSVSIVSYVLSRTRHYRVGSYFFSYSFTAIAFITLYLGTASGFGSSIASTGHIAIIVASILLSLRGFSVLVVLSIIAAFTAPLYSRTPISLEGGFFRDAGIFASLGVILIGSIIFRRQIEQDRLKEMQHINRELEDLTENQEQRIQVRTQELVVANQQAERRASQLSVVAEVARSVASIQNSERLLSSLTRLISTQFGFYHVGIFLSDEKNEMAVLSAANSEGGQRMLARDHRLKIGEQGIVGFVAFQGKARVALNVGEEAVFFNNPDLPDTHSELALPLKFGQYIIGVLDIQSEKTNAFSQEDVEILSVLADQVSVAIQNARSLEQAQRAAREAEVASSQLIKEAWSGFTDNLKLKGYRFDGVKLEALREVQKPSPENDTLLIPVELRGQTIGRLRLKASSATRAWTEDELAIIQSTADRIALALESARLLDEAQKRAARETFLSTVGTKLGASFQLDSILRDTVEELGQTLKGSTVSFQLVNPSAPPTAKENGGTTKEREPG